MSNELQNSPSNNDVFNAATILPSSQEIPERLDVNPPFLGITGFREFRQIGRGGMWTVYEAAMQNSLNRKVAVKVLNAELSEDPNIVKRFQHEMQILVKLNHPNIVQVFDCGTSGKHLHYVMELVTGKSGEPQTLRELITQQKQIASFMDEQKAADLVLQIAGALQYAHDHQIIHRDLKPENILIDDRFHLQAKVTDFGIAAWHDNPARTELTSATASLGTWAYMPPEQHQSAARVDHRADIYSLGVMLYEMLTGKLPMGALVLPSKANSSLNSDWDKLITTMLQQDPCDRPQSMNEVIENVKAIQNKKPKTVEFSIERVVESFSYWLIYPFSWAFQNKKVAAILGTVLVVCCIIFADACNQNDKEYDNSSTPVTRTVQSGKTAGERMVLKVKGVEYAFRWCPSGSFMMGSPESEKDRYSNETQHLVTLSRGFWIQETELTQEQWTSIMGNNPSLHKGSRLPVERVSWDDCLDYLSKLNKAVSSSYKFSLPTESQWEYACRAGTTTPFSFGSELNGDKANCNGNNPYGTDTKGKWLVKTTVAGSYAANSWGIYDMHGNVEEWCKDGYGTYPSGSVTDPTGATDGSARVARGGSWFHYARGCRSAYRHSDAPTSRGNILGVRLVLVSNDKEDKEDNTSPVTLTVKSGKSAGERMVLKVKGVDYAFRWCPSGSFMMGSPESEEDRIKNETRHLVTLSRGFWIQETELTQEQWTSIMVNNPSNFKGSRLPVERVSWDDCLDYLSKLNKAVPSSYKFSLPTESQWEYACRAGTTTPFNFGVELNGDKANCNGNFPYGTDTKGKNLRKTTVVGSYAANAWGIYDMHGNVSEWCKDLYGEAYPSGGVTDPTGATDGSSRVIRGGDWGNLARFCRSANRDDSTPSHLDNDLGFRLVLVSNDKEDKEDNTSFVTLTVKSGKSAGERMVLKVKGVEYAFRWCPSDSFMMGSPESEKDRNKDETQHRVTLSRGFWIQETELTQEQWTSIMGNNPSYFQGSRLPVECVSWDDCQDYLSKLNKAVSSSYRFSLPTESQWEYACRAGTTTPFSFGSELNGDKANCYGYFPYGTDTEGKYLRKTTVVGSYAANSWGIYDMHGNVHEWCKDLYGAYPSGSVTDPTGATDGSSRVARGGSWFHYARGCRSAIRFTDTPAKRHERLGVRLVLVSNDKEDKEDNTSFVTLTVKSGKTAGERMVLKVKGVDYAFRWCPAGSFMMGSPESERDRDNDETRHRVTLSKGFWMQETEVTQEQWTSIMVNNPSNFKGSRLPVERVSWNDCQDYLSKLNKAVSSSYKFSLPTEAQWEYACRAGTTTPFSFGSELNGDKANCDGNNPYGTDTKGKYLEKTTVVGSYAANAWGIYDMHGNVSEWCKDLYGEAYPSGGVTDPMGATDGSSRVRRGGSWFSDAKRCRSANRNDNTPTNRDNNLGVRLVLVSEN